MPPYNKNINNKNKDMKTLTYNLDSERISVALTINVNQLPSGIYEISGIVTCGTISEKINKYEWNKEEAGILTTMAIAYNRLTDRNYNENAEMLRKILVNYGKENGF